MKQLLPLSGIVFLLKLVFLNSCAIFAQLISFQLSTNLTLSKNLFFYKSFEFVAIKLA